MLPLPTLCLTAFVASTKGQWEKFQQIEACPTVAVSVKSKLRDDFLREHVVHAVVQAKSISIVEALRWMQEHGVPEKTAGRLRATLFNDILIR